MGIKGRPLNRFSLEGKCRTLAFTFRQAGRFVFTTNVRTILFVLLTGGLYFLMILILIRIIHHRSPNQ